MQNYDEIQVAVWSVPGDQDDLHWFHVPEHGMKKIEYTMPLDMYDTDGTYLIDVYGVKKGRMIFVTNTEINIEFPIKMKICE